MFLFSMVPKWQNCHKMATLGSTVTWDPPWRDPDAALTAGSHQWAVFQVRCIPMGLLILSQRYFPVWCCHEQGKPRTGHLDSSARSAASKCNLGGFCSNSDFFFSYYYMKIWAEWHEVLQVHRLCENLCVGRGGKGQVTSHQFWPGLGGKLDLLNCAAHRAFSSCFYFFSGTILEVTSVTQTHNACCFSFCLEKLCLKLHQRAFVDRSFIFTIGNCWLMASLLVLSREWS